MFYVLSFGFRKVFFVAFKESGRNLLRRNKDHFLIFNGTRYMVLVDLLFSDEFSHVQNQIKKLPASIKIKIIDHNFGLLSLENIFFILKCIFNKYLL